MAFLESFIKLSDILRYSTSLFYKFIKIFLFYNFFSHKGDQQVGSKNKFGDVQL